MTATTVQVRDAARDARDASAQSILSPPQTEANRGICIENVGNVVTRMAQLVARDLALIVPASTLLSAPCFTAIC